MRKLLIAALAFVGSMVPAFAQGFIPTQQPQWVYAADYGRWALPGQNANTYTFTPSNQCQITQLNFRTASTFFAFGSKVALAPVLIADVNGTNSEVVTPGSAATQTQTTCAVNLSPTNSHTTFTLQSGTAGLQEALNTYVGTIIIDKSWYGGISSIASLNAALTNKVTAADVITSATCAAGQQVVDVTAIPFAFYGCNASSKLQVSTPQPAVSVAAGTGSGTSPTIAVLAGSNQSMGTITLTSGTTPTASAAVFTLTLSAPSYGGGFRYAPACKVVSVGTTAYTSGVVTSTAGTTTTPGTLVFTASATALAASTAGYKFTYTCY